MPVKTRNEANCQIKSELLQLIQYTIISYLYIIYI